MVERCVRDAEAAGSSPVTSTNKKKVPFGIFFLFLLIVGLEPEKVCRVKKTVRWTVFSKEVRRRVPQGKALGSSSR